MGCRKVVEICPDERAVIKKLSTLIETIANESINTDGKFTVGLSGGSLTKFLSRGLPNIETDWSKWLLFFCDERLAPSESPDSNFGAYKRLLGESLPIKDSQYIIIAANKNAEEAAVDYSDKIKYHFPSSDLPRFNLLLLGMGEDGHTCSLFPNHNLLTETSLLVAPIIDSPKPPPARITLTFPVINNSENCIFAISGVGKANMIKRVLEDGENLPVNMVTPKNGSLYWILDEAAASLLKKSAT